MLGGLFKLVKECVARNIPPSTLVKECALNIDEAALHKGAFELSDRIAEMDYSQITNEKLEGDLEPAEIPRLKENRKQLKAIKDVVVDSKERSRQDEKRGRKEERKVLIESPNKIPTLKHNNSKIVIEQGFNEGKSFHTGIETDRDPIDEVQDDRLQSSKKLNERRTSVAKDSPKGELAFKLDSNDLMNIKLVDEHKNSSAQLNKVNSNHVIHDNKPTE